MKTDTLHTNIWNKPNSHLQNSVVVFFHIWKFAKLQSLAKHLEKKPRLLDDSPPYYMIDKDFKFVF